MNNNTNENVRNNATINVVKLAYEPTISIMDINVKDIVDCVNTTLRPIIPGYIAAVADVNDRGISFKILIDMKSPLLKGSFLNNLNISVKNSVQLTDELITKLSIYCDKKIKYDSFKGRVFITLNAEKVIAGTFPKPENGWGYKLKVVQPSNRKRKYFGKIRLIKAKLNLFREIEETQKDNKDE